MEHERARTGRDDALGLVVRGADHGPVNGQLANAADGLDGVWPVPDVELMGFKGVRECG